VAKPSVAFFVMPQEGHFHALRPLISGLAGRGLRPYVVTAREYEAHVERAGGELIDVFGRYPIERADRESFPPPCRFVSFAGCYAEEIIADLGEIGPSLVVYDEHAVIGRVVGAALGVPYVSVSPAHNVSPARLGELLASLPRVHISDTCRRAVAKLRERYGLHDASPFSFAAGLSPFLNVYGEPSAFLTEAERRAFEPVAFHGCLPTLEEIERTSRVSSSRYIGGDGSDLRVYVSFGTVVWRYWPAEALDALTAISESLAATRGVRAVISLGGAQLEAEAVHALTKPNVSVTGYVDQWQILREADAFVTHNGLKSTHESIFNAVPMISYPFFWDQPALAERCRQFGLAVPLVGSPRQPVSEEHVRAALSAVSHNREAMSASLDRAREWELEAINGRDAVLSRITDLLRA
jgi:UDP:flavonoid glycosyltransferase YjiC (YdhE family)